MSEPLNEQRKREVLKGIAAGTVWVTPVLQTVMLGARALTTNQVALAVCEASDPVPTSFSFTGSVQSFTVPVGISSLKITAIGADGGNSSGGGEGGAGGCAAGVSGGGGSFVISGASSVSMTAGASPVNSESHGSVTIIAS